MGWLADYGLFFAKTFTLVIAIIILFAGILSVALKGKEKGKGKLQVKKLNKKYEEIANTLAEEVLPKSEYKAFLKNKKKQDKAEDKSTKKRIFVLEFNGDIRAAAVANLSEEITAVLTTAKPGDEVVVKLESPGGLVNAYGLAASQLKRIKEQALPLTIIIDKVAASGGYLMACVADKILAAPFAIIGSIGVIAQLPNFHRLLKKHNIDFEQITAGEFKRTLTIFGENTDKARQKFKEELEEIHVHFKDFIIHNRPQVNINEIATGEHWLASRARELNLVDGLITSDDYLLKASANSDLFQVTYKEKKGLGNKLLAGMSLLLQKFGVGVY